MMKLSKIMITTDWFQAQKFISFNELEWASRASEVLQKALDSVLSSKGACSVMLTGGKTANELYANWSQIESFKRVHNVSFYYGDERCVPMTSADSNYAMSMATLFSGGIPESCKVFPMFHDGEIPAHAAASYSERLPNSIDILILAFGEDGHIASIFPEMLPFNAMSPMVTTSSSKKYPFTRITITPEVIGSAGSIFVVAKGGSKGGVIFNMVSEPLRALNIPLALVKKAIWILDDKALAGIVEYI
jgi:6-phosphogluconolactonase